MGDVAEDAQRKAETEIEEGEVVDEGDALPEIETRDPNELLAEKGMEIVRHERVTVDPATMPTPNEFRAMMEVARTVANTTFVPATLRGKPESVVAAILTGRELGIGPMQALKSIDIIDGKPAPSASLLLALMRRGGLIVMESESTAEWAWIKARRNDTGEVMEVKWTYEEASQIQRRGKPLIDGDNWKNYPADMLWARAVGRLARRLGGDLTAGFGYSAEEVRDFDVEGESWDADNPYAGMTVRQGGEKPVLRNWEEIAKAVTEYDPDGALGLVEHWIPQLYFRFAGVESRREMTEEQQRKVGVLLADIVVDLVREAPSDQMPPPSRDQIAAVFAKHLDGEVLAGPPWRLHPSEEELPTRGAEDPVAPAAEPAPEGKDEPVEAAEPEPDEIERIADETFRAPNP